jgi:hypothetical protein
MPTGQPGKTHCGAWVPVEACEEYGWATRLVCNLPPGNHEEHESWNGWRWPNKNYTR